MRFITLSLIWVGIVVLAACSSFDQAIPSYSDLLYEQSGQDGRRCIQSGDIRGYGVLDDSVISVSTRKRDKYYLVTTAYRCNSLELSNKVAFVGAFTEFCGGGRDRVHTGSENCIVEHIIEYESREQAFEAFDQMEEKRRELKRQQLEAKGQDKA